MTQRNPIKSEFFTFYINTQGTDSEQSSAGSQFYAVNVSGAREVVFSTLTAGWYVTNKSYNEVFDAQPAIKTGAQIMHLPFLSDSRGVTPLVTHTNDDMLYVFFDPDAGIKGTTKCFVWVIR